MAVPKNIVCPHCKKALSHIGGFYHDDKLNLLCSLCNGIIFAATKEQEDKSKHTLVSHATAVTYTGDTWKKREVLPIKTSPGTVTTAGKNTLACRVTKEYTWWA